MAVGCFGFVSFGVGCLFLFIILSFFFCFCCCELLIAFVALVAPVAVVAAADFFVDLLKDSSNSGMV